LILKLPTLEKRLVLKHFSFYDIIYGHKNKLKLANYEQFSLTLL